MKRSSFFARIALAAFSCFIVIASNSCSAGVIHARRRADLRLRLTIPTELGTANVFPDAPRAVRLMDPSSASVKVQVERSGRVIRELTETLAGFSPVLSLTVSDIPIDDTPAAVTVSCLNPAGLALCSGTAEVLINEKGSTVYAAMVLAPTSLAGTTIDIGTLSSYSQGEILSAAAGTATLYRIVTSESEADYAVSLGLTDGVAIFYDSNGLVEPQTGGTPEQWAILTFGGSVPAFVLFYAAGGNATAKLGVERAVYVSASGSGSGTRGSPLSGSSFNETYGGFTGPTRFILNGGTFPGDFSLFDRGSIYGGFSQDFSERDLENHRTVISGTFSGTPDQVLLANGITFAALDGLTVTSSSSTESGSSVDHATIRVLNSGIRISACTVHSPRQGLEFSFTASTNIISALYIQGQSGSVPIIIVCNDFLGRGQNWILGANSGGSAATVGLIIVAETSTDVLIAGNVINGGWETDTNTNSALEVAGGIIAQTSAAQPWIVGNTIAAAGGTTSQVTINSAAVRGGTALNGYLVNNLIFALKEYVATMVWTNLLYMAGSTNQFNLLVWNYLTVMYQGSVNSLYYDTATMAQTVAALNSVWTNLNTAQASNNSGNPLFNITYADYKASLDQLMVDFDGPSDDRSDYANMDFNLAGSAPTTVRSGGLDLSDSGNLPSGFPAELVPYLFIDRGGMPRHSGSWSIGAYQAGN